MIDLVESGLLTPPEISAAINAAVAAEPNLADAPVRLTQVQLDHVERLVGESAEYLSDSYAYVYRGRRNAEPTIFGHPLSIFPDDFAREAAAAYAAAYSREIEAKARKIAEETLPRRLRWLVDHPRLLGYFYRVRPSLRPTVTIPVKAIAPTGRKDRSPRS